MKDLLCDPVMIFLHGPLIGYGQYFLHSHIVVLRLQGCYHLLKYQLKHQQ